MKTIRIYDSRIECPVCKQGDLILHTEADQDHEEGPFTWYCTDGDRVECPCGLADLVIVTNHDGDASVQVKPRVYRQEPALYD